MMMSKVYEDDRGYLYRESPESAGRYSRHAI